ncbi:efflux RND transporter periplasmic adaptor subunit [bacterium]|nr:efflux RND transporter periplasmic adaptor subunit [bacterium]
MNNTNGENLEILETLKVDSSGWKKKTKIFLISAFIIIIGFVTFHFWSKSDKVEKQQYKTQEVTQGDLIVTVTATGVLQPVNQVEVGTEVSGTIKSVLVDYNDQVKAGQILAILDTVKLEALVLQSESAVASANSSLLDSRAKLDRARKELNRLQETWSISNGKTPSKNALDTAEATVKSLEAEESIAKANINQEQAMLDSRKSDLTKATIRSPINGIVLIRNVEPGQTVAASLQTPVLFTLAEDLTKMELLVNVDEADVGQVKEGQNATFTVDAFPDKEFKAIITQVRFSPKTENGVVIYETLLSLDNSDLLLRPGMTATANINVTTIENAVLVPNSALRFNPPTVYENSEKQPEVKRSFLDSIFPRRHRPSERNQPKFRKHETSSRVWILQDGQPKPFTVVKGATDGFLTEVTSDELKPGMKVIVDTESKKSD